MKQLLAPAHLEDLKRSGLSDPTIEAMGVFTIPPSEHKKHGLPQKVNSAYAIPYPGTDSIRYRQFYAEGDKGPKYFQAKGSGNRLYIPASITGDLLGNAGIPLNIVEGEKKAARARQDGLLCIGLSGLWNWTNGNGELLPDFDQITLKDREVFFIPDNDWLSPDKHGYRKNLHAAVYRLAHKLLDRGAKVFIVSLPPGDLKGIDDYLMKHTVEDLKQLPAKEITPVMQRADTITESELTDFLKEVSAIESEVARALIINKISKRFKIGKKQLAHEITGKQRKADRESEDTTFSAIFPGLVDLGINDKGEIVFIIARENGIIIEGSYEIDNVKYCPPKFENIPYPLSKTSEVLKHYTNDDTALFRDIFSYLKKFSYLPEPYFVLLTCKVFLSYIQDHPDIHYMPMILFYAVPERGKSRTGKAMTTICYRAIHLVDLREANIFRFAQYWGASLYFDFMNIWERAKHNDCEDILLCRFEKGAQIFRVLNMDAGPYQDQTKFSVYGATILSTNEPLHKILDSRCLPIIPPNRPGRYLDSLPSAAQTLRERLLAWRAKAMFMKLPEIEDMRELSGRLWDISRPLLQVCLMTTCQGVYETLKKLLIEISNQRREDRAQTIEGRIVAFINELSDDKVEEWEIKTSGVVDKLNETRPEGQKLSSQYVGKKLKAMSIKTRISHGRSHIYMNSETLEMLLAQYNFSETDTNSPYSPNSPALTVEPVYERERVSESGESGDNGESGESYGNSIELFDTSESGESVKQTHRAQTHDSKGSGESGESGESGDRGKKMTQCNLKPAPWGICNSFTMKIGPGNALSPYCLKGKVFCPNSESAKGVTKDMTVSEK